jgi:hypothetical protein
MNKPKNGISCHTGGQNGDKLQNSVHSEKTRRTHPSRSVSAMERWLFDNARSRFPPPRKKKKKKNSMKKVRSQVRKTSAKSVSPQTEKCKQQYIIAEACKWRAQNRPTGSVRAAVGKSFAVS